MRRLPTYVALLIVLAAVPVQAQTAEALLANIPFGFYAGDRWMPAGEYKLCQRGPFLALLSRETQAETYMLVISGQRMGETAAPSVAFRVYSADRIFLAQVRNPWWGASQDLVKSKREREVVSSRVISQNRPETVVILARVGR